MAPATGTVSFSVSTEVLDNETGVSEKQEQIREAISSALSVIGVSAPSISVSLTKQAPAVAVEEVGSG